MKKTIFNSDWQNGFDACLSFGVIGVFIAQSLSFCLFVCLSLSSQTVCVLPKKKKLKTTRSTHTVSLLYADDIETKLLMFQMIGL